jgi:hypothetical protein
MKSLNFIILNAQVNKIIGNELKKSQQAL